MGMNNKVRISEPAKDPSVLIKEDNAINKQARLEMGN